MTFEEDTRLWEPDKSLGLVASEIQMKADEALVRAQLDRAVAGMAKDLMFAGLGWNSHCEGVEVYLNTTKITIPAQSWMMRRWSRYGTGPLTEAIVKEALTVGCFVVENIDVHIAMRELRRFRLRRERQYEYEITFSTVPSPEVLELSRRWREAAEGARRFDQD